MNAGGYKSWIERAFLSVEGALASELATPGRLGMTEDYIRGALVRGLLITHPNEAHRVTREQDAKWTGNACFHNPAHKPGAGRSIQHDVAIRPSDADVGLVCEVKWLSQAQSRNVAADIWKLALSRSVSPEGAALRTYLLLGGESKIFSSVLTALRSVGLNLRWSAAGRGGNIPRPSTLSLQGSLSHSLSRNAWASLVGWGSQPHYRSSPETWASLRASVRSRWWRTIPVDSGMVGWRMVLWELDHRGISSDSQVNWPPIYSDIPHSC